MMAADVLAANRLLKAAAAPRSAPTAVPTAPTFAMAARFAGTAVLTAPAKLRAPVVATLAATDAEVGLAPAVILSSWPSVSFTGPSALAIPTDANSAAAARPHQTHRPRRSRDPLARPVGCRFAPIPVSGCFSGRREPRPETTPRLAYRVLAPPGLALIAIQALRKLRLRRRVGPRVARTRRQPTQL